MEDSENGAKRVWNGYIEEQLSIFFHNSRRQNKIALESGREKKSWSSDYRVLHDFSQNTFTWEGLLLHPSAQRHKGRKFKLLDVERPGKKCCGGFKNCTPPMTTPHPWFLFKTNRTKTSSGSGTLWEKRLGQIGRFCFLPPPIFRLGRIQNRRSHIKRYNTYTNPYPNQEACLEGATFEWTRNLAQPSP